MSITDKAKDKAKKNPTWLLGILLAVHLVVVSFNRAPGQSDLWVFQKIFLSIAAPFQSAWANSIAMFKNVGSNYISMRDARVENEKLRAERASLESQLRAMSERVVTLEQIDVLQKWQVDHKYDGVQARVVARDANQLFNTVMIDKGTTSGIAKDQPVVTSEGLVGRVVNAWPISSQVLLITDERHGAGAVIGQTERSRLLGVVRGKKEYLCEMRFIGPPEMVENGEPVITSGQDGIYPKGLLIGRVRKPDGETTVAPQVVKVEPAAPLGRLEMVSVLAVPPDQIHRALETMTNEEKKQEKAPDRKKSRPGI